MLDTLISGGTVFDGSGEAGKTADVGIKDGQIVCVGKITQTAKRVINATGAIVTPGFVDIHTHYDAQATWASRLSPSSHHGVTTAVMGNCGVGFAPVRSADHDVLIELMEGVEDIPGVVMSEGLPWQWESFGEFMNYLSERQFDMDLGAQLPHAALRVYVMGQRGVDRLPATAEDVAQMRKLACSAMQAGALGFSTSRWLHHKTSSGDHTPTLTAGTDELVGIAMGLADAGKGVIQVISQFDDFESEFALLREVVERSGRPLSLSLSEELSEVSWRDVLAQIEIANADGLRILGQVAPRPIGAVLGLTSSLSPFSGRSSFRALSELPLEAKCHALKDPELRAKIIAEPCDAEYERLEDLIDGGKWLWEMDEQPNYEPSEHDTVAFKALAQGLDPVEFMYDRMVDNGGKTLFYTARANYQHGNLDACREMVLHPNTVLGLGDGGAHVGIICDASFPTTLLTHWHRDRGSDGPIKLETLVKLQTRDSAAAVGLEDRGLIAEGKKADINVIDIKNLKALRPFMVHDLPAGGGRFQQLSEGYVATLVSGEMTYSNGEPTDELPGRLIRA